MATYDQMMMQALGMVPRTPIAPYTGVGSAAYALDQFPGLAAAAGPVQSAVGPNFAGMNMSQMMARPNMAGMNMATTMNAAGPLQSMVKPNLGAMNMTGFKGAMLGPTAAEIPAGPTLAARLGLSGGAGIGGSTLTKAAGMRALGLAGAGLVGGGLVDSFNIGGDKSNWDRGFSGAARGAGVGAAIGSVVPVIGTATGALVGGGLGAAINIFGPKGKSKEEQAAIATQKGATSLMQLMGSAGLDVDTQNTLLQQYGVMVQMAGGDKKAIGQVASSMQQQVMTAMAEQAQMEKQTREQQKKIAMVLQLQTQMGQAMAPALEQYGRDQSYIAKTLASTTNGMPDGPMKDAILKVAATSAQGTQGMIDAKTQAMGSVPFDYAMSLLQTEPANAEQATQKRALTELLAR